MSGVLTNFVTYLPSPTSQPRVGNLDFSTRNITPLSFPSGTPVTSLYQVINAGKATRFIPSSRHGGEIPLSSVTLLPPLSERDVMAVGKNYSEHAKEFNSSGYDSSDKVDIPTHPVIFTKRASSIIASGDSIYPHHEWTETLDYEGEIGVILGKEGLGIKEEDAWDHVWGFTIINDITARERQRDHKQFFLGKSADTFCPMGPIAVPLTSIPNYRSLRLITKVNGELRQDSDLTQLIFSVPTLIATISSAITVRSGDVIATGTPAGVGIGRKPPIFLKPGDTVTVSVSGLGTLRNTVAAANPPPGGIRHIPVPNSAEKGLTRLATSGKLVHIERFGNLSSTNLVIFIHGLGGSTHFYHPAIITSGVDGGALEQRQLLLYDLEGHGLSPTTPDSVVSVASLTADLRDLILTLGLQGSEISFAAHSLGCLVALNYHAEFRDETSFYRFVLISLPSIPLPASAAERLYKLAETARVHGMLPIVGGLIAEGISSHSQTNNPLAVAYVRTILANTNFEGYAKGCTALAAAQKGSMAGTAEWFEDIFVQVYMGAEDKITPPDDIRDMSERLGYQYNKLEGVGHWCVIENVLESQTWLCFDRGPSDI